MLDSIYLTTKESATLFRITIRQFHSIRKNKDFPKAKRLPSRTGGVGKILFKKSDLIKYIDSLVEQNNNEDNIHLNSLPTANNYKKIQKNKVTLSEFLDNPLAGDLSHGAT